MKKLMLGVILFGGLAGTAVHIGAAAPGTKVISPSTVSHEDSEFFQKAAEFNMLEMQAATVAGTRAMAPDTKAYASSMTTGHMASAEALQTLAASKGVTLPTQLGRKDRDVLKDLQAKKPKQFDEQYAEAMAKQHEEAVELFTETAKDSKDADIRAFASDALPTLQQHWEMAKHLNDKG